MLVDGRGIVTVYSYKNLAGLIAYCRTSCFSEYSLKQNYKSNVESIQLIRDIASPLSDHLGPVYWMLFSRHLKIIFFYLILFVF